MTTLLTVFLLTFLLSLALTPLCRWLGLHFGALDRPSSRKVHSSSTPRCGGCGIFLAFLLGAALVPLLQTDISELLDFHNPTLAFLGGSVICFAIGLIDDFKGLSHRVKLIAQILAASMAFWGGLHIGVPWDLGLPEPVNAAISFTATLFWFLLFINAVNLIDGLDGLAGGIVLFVCLFMLIFLVLERNFALALLFALLGGAVTGFLPYNFSETRKIFMGDSGSYFLGFALASLGIMGSIKSHLGATMLIPLVALGVPVFDTLLAPVRRFVLAKEPFKPDKGHIHHRLMAMGLSNKRVVMIIYGATLLLCIVAVLIVNIRDETIGLFLILLGSMAALFARKVGYFSFVDNQKIQSWIRDLSFVTGIAKDRRRFLNLQLCIQESKTLEELWQHMTHAFEELKLDYAEIHLDQSFFLGLEASDCSKGTSDPAPVHQKASRSLTSSLPFFSQIWSRNGFALDVQGCRRNLFKLELPIQVKKKHIGELWVIKDIKQEPINHYTLTRIEHMRRSVSRCLEKMDWVQPIEAAAKLRRREGEH